MCSIKLTNDLIENRFSIPMILLLCFVLVFFSERLFSSSANIAYRFQHQFISLCSFPVPFFCYPVLCQHLRQKEFIFLNNRKSDLP